MKLEPKVSGLVMYISLDPHCLEIYLEDRDGHEGDFLIVVMRKARLEKMHRCLEDNGVMLCRF